MKVKRDRMMKLVGVVVAGCFMTSMDLSALKAQPLPEVPESVESLLQRLKENEKLNNPYCKPKLKALKREIKEQKQLLQQTKVEQERRELIKRLYDLHEDLRQTRETCLSSRPRHEVDETVED